MNFELVKESFNAVKPIADEFLGHFYKTLFKNHPEAEPLFANTAMKMQKQKLAGSLIHVIEFFDEPEHLSQYLQDMGGRHLNYGAEEEHYDWVGEALIETFRYYFGENWTPEAETSWGELYGYMATEMKEGMRAANTGRVIEMHTEKREPTLEELAREHARAMLQQILDEEINSELKALAAEKIREVLKKAIDSESRNILNSLKVKSA